MQPDHAELRLFSDQSFESRAAGGVLPGLRLGECKGPRDGVRQDHDPVLCAEGQGRAR